MALKQGITEELPQDPKLVAVLAAATVPSPLEAIVELVTNSDDSYLRLEQQKRTVSSRIWVILLGKKGGGWRLIVADHAEGMDAGALDRATVFGAAASGFEEGKSVRGLFGRGLKESIVALGSGRIITVRDGKESEIRIFKDASGRAYRQVVVLERPTNVPNGTIVAIEALDQSFPRPETLRPQIENHFALRPILERRHVFLGHHSISKYRHSIEDLVENLTSDALLVLPELDDSFIELKWVDPEGQLVLQESFEVEGLGVARLEVFEAVEKLDFEFGQPWSKAGFVILSEGVPLDLDLFGLEGDEAALYFYGSLDCPGIAAALRSQDFRILSPNRSGLNWRERRCRALRRAARQRIKPLIEQKRRTLLERSAQPLRGRKIRKLMQLLNNIALSELEPEQEDLTHADTVPQTLSGLVIKPEKAYAFPLEPRSFSIYLASDSLTAGDSPTVILELIESEGEIILSSSTVPLRMDPDRSIFKGMFSVMGSDIGNRAVVRGYLGTQPDLRGTVELIVREPSHREREKLTTPGRGLFREIEFDPTPDPIQRVYCGDDGIIRIYVEFPPLRRYFRPGQEAADANAGQGAIMFAELILEALCNRVARLRVVREGVPIGDPQAAVDYFNSHVSDLRKRHAAAIHNIWVGEG